MKYYTIILGFLLCCMAHIYAGAVEIDQPKATAFLGKDWSLEMALKSGYVQGDTTYKITFLGGASELEFPLRHSLLGFEVALGHKGFGPEKEFPGRLVLNWAFNTTTEKGKMEDSDWIDNDVAFFTDLGVPGSAHAGKDIYSESNAKLKANIVDISYVFDLDNVPTRSRDPEEKPLGATSFGKPKMTISAMVGYRTQKFEYEISDTVQVGYGPYAPYFTGNVPGKTLEYRVRYKFPYLGAKVEAMLKDQTRGSFYLGFSNWVTARDLDDHILRRKIAKADCTGSAFIMGLGLQWVVKPEWFIQFDTSLLQIDTDGIQKQIWYGDDPASSGFDDTGSSVKVKDEITASIWTTYLSISHKF